MNTQRRLRLTLKYVILCFVALLFLFPFAWMLATSLKTNTEALTNPTALLPAVPQWGNYPAVIQALNFWRETFNSLVMALGVTFGQIYLMLAGWGGWLNTFAALIVPSLASPFAIFVFRQFFITVPKELDEAAKIDGAGYYRVFWSVMLPLAGPAIATVFILTFLAEWSSLLKPLVFTSSPDLYTLQQGLAVTLNRGANLVPNVATLMAGVVLASIVPVVMFLIGQRYFVRSVASSGLKG